MSNPRKVIKGQSGVRMTDTSDAIEAEDGVGTEESTGEPIVEIMPTGEAKEKITAGTQMDSKEFEGWEEQKPGKSILEKSTGREKAPDTKGKKVRILGAVFAQPEKKGRQRWGSDDEDEDPTRPDKGLSFPPSYLAKIKAIKDSLKTSVADCVVPVKVMLIPADQIFTVNFKLGLVLRQLKEHFSDLLKIPLENLQFMHEGRIVRDVETLMHLEVMPDEIARLDLFSSDSALYPVKRIYQKMKGLNNVITVRVQSGAKVYQDIIVEIEKTDFHKPFLGGFRHKITGIEYHNAGTQTAPKKLSPKVSFFTRSTQTVVEKKKLVATTNRTSTQMTKIGVYVSNMTDKLLTPRKYFTADEYHAKRLAAVLVIQRYFRKWLAKKIVKGLKEQKKVRLEWEKQEERRKEKEKKDWLKREYERRINPYSDEDFELLFRALEDWRVDQMDYIDENFTGAERKAALCELLEKETQIIASIGRQRIRANNKRQEKSITRFLDKCSAPKKWISSNNTETVMDTQYTIRARELQDIYNCIIIKNICDDERLDVLLTLKHTVKEHECKLTQDILELIDREVDLMMRGVKCANLEGLRKRIATLFLQYIKTPLFNPEVARHLKVPQDPAKLYKNIYFCHSCGKYLPSTEFSISSTSYHIIKCRKCCMLDNEARQREAFLKYKILLKELYQSEAEYDDDSQIAYLIQLHDLQYLIENIWASQSALSAWDDLYDLVIVRWDKTQEWAPWNCILLTKDEAVAHLKIKKLEEGYEPVFIHRIKHKHILAKNYFSQIPMMASILHHSDVEEKTMEEDIIETKENDSNQIEEEEDEETVESKMSESILQDT
ncbi:IQ and ubiquitin-like domain-containing protein [Sarcophilus harrisii]|uniref:IQ motif and ubiquitin domain containing n=1 Tax=Sarcophilus harrisii TaxID=9305 RepID=G3W1R0_SARHA|nr:IQ and ubiquitin-like domain-containing protein [Sarcophilus harrisii]XP_031794805.1 IQ and ubiquitin-like domain-containing protein [Sarcophilus harrisii]XP_031794806.1 IQ and ubiquitin-like domain-containing protein [Sarcophilus harrisii]